MYRLYACRRNYISKNDNRARKIKNNVYNKIYFDSVLKQCIDMYNFDEFSEIADAYQLMSTFKNENTCIVYMRVERMILIARMLTDQE